MTNSGLPDLNQIGKKYIEKWLTENGYSDILNEMLQSNEEGLVATGRVENVLVQIKTFLHPHRPYKLSDYEIDVLTRRANKLNSIAYAAYVVIDSSGDLIEEINWERLS